MKYFSGLVLFCLLACNQDADQFDASGTFESDEVLVSAELNGKILGLTVREGSQLAADSIVGSIDAKQIFYQKEQVEASIEALRDRTSDVQPQIKLLRQQLQVQQAQLDYLVKEKDRVNRLIQLDAATGKQMDDLLSQIAVLNQQMLVTKQEIQVRQNNIGTQNRGVMSEKGQLGKRIAQLDDQLTRANIVNPVQGTVLAKYAEAGEVTSAGRPLYKIANLDTVYLRAYITGSQLPLVKLNQPVQVYIDSGENHYMRMPGTVSWIADKAEFTPKTIQTKDERANLVYALKIRVANPGAIKIGMYGEVKFKDQP